MFSKPADSHLNTICIEDGNPDTTAVIVAARRLPNAKAGAAFKHVQAHELAAPLLARLVQENHINPAEISDVILGNATGGSGNVARLAALTAGLPDSVPGLTVDRQCGSGLEAIVLACRLVQAGAGDLYLAGGVESISTAPARAHRAPDGSLKFFDRAQFAPLDSGDPDAGTAAENVAAHYGISRARQDDYARNSHEKAVRAAQAGHFDSEILPLAGLAADQGPRPRLTLELLARFPAVFVAGGTVTAGNSCPYSDGAAAVLVASLSKAREMAAHCEWGPVLVFQNSAVAGNDPNLLGVGAAHAMHKLMADTGITTAQLLNSRIEFNEAFAAQVLAVADLLELEPDLFNHDGGALALGHPYGASGAVLVTRLLAQARRAAILENPESAGDAFAMISMAGGMGIATHFTHQEL